MSKLIEVKSEGRILKLIFPERPRTKVRTDLWDYDYEPLDPKGTIWIMKEFELNNQMFIASFEYLKKLGYRLNKTDFLEKQLSHIITKEVIYQVLEKGKLIKNSQCKKILIPNFKRELKKYPIMPVIHIKELLSAANFSVPGSGKTTIILAGFSLLKNEGKVNKLIVIGPYSCLMPWEEEISACFRKVPSVIRIHGSLKFRYGIYIKKYKNYDIFLTTYHSAYNDMDYLIDLVQKDKFMIVLDESHYIKNIDGKISSAILRLSTLSSSKIALTGTPIPNSINDIYSQITFLYPESVIGSKDKFKYMVRTHSDPDHYIKEKIYPIFTRISKSQLNLPPTKVYTIEVPMSDIQEKLYKLVSERINNILETEAELISFDKIFEYKKCKFVRLRQIASNVNLLVKKSWEYNLESLKRELSIKSEPKTERQILSIINNLDRYSEFEVSPKFIKTIELVEKLKSENKKKIVIWSDFIINLETLYKFFKVKYRKDKVFLVIGDTPKSKAEHIKNGIYTPESREDRIYKFKKNPDEFSILIANPQACAESISLHTVCHDAIYVDRSYNCGQYIQSKDRIHRIGLDENVLTTYYILISTSDALGKACIDELIHTRLIEKEEKMLDILNDINSFEGSNDPAKEDDEELFDFI